MREQYSKNGNTGGILEVGLCGRGRTTRTGHELGIQREGRKLKLGPIPIPDRDGSGTEFMERYGSETLSHAFI